VGGRHHIDATQQSVPCEVPGLFRPSAGASKPTRYLQVPLQVSVGSSPPTRKAPVARECPLGAAVLRQNRWDGALDEALGPFRARVVLSLSSFGALAWLLASLSAPSPIESGAEVAHDVGPLVVADGRTVVAGPVDVPEAARASADASAADGHASGHAILGRALDPLDPDPFASRSVRTDARSIPRTTSSYAPRSSRGPPSA
jgi:hypothetical protein